MPEHPSIGSLRDSLLVSVWITPIETNDGRTSLIAPKLRRMGKILQLATAELTPTANRNGVPIRLPQLPSTHFQAATTATRTHAGQTGTVRLSATLDVIIRRPGPRWTTAHDVSCNNGNHLFPYHDKHLSKQDYLAAPTVKESFFSETNSTLVNYGAGSQMVPGHPRTMACSKLPQNLLHLRSLPIPCPTH